MESRWEGILAWIFPGFWWILEARLGRQIEPRQGKTKQDKDQGKTRQDKTLADKERRFFGHLVALHFFTVFFDAIFDASWFDFPSQLASEHPPKSIKNRCQDALAL